MSTRWIGRGERVGGELGGGGENWKGNQKEGRGNQSKGVKREKERKKVLGIIQMGTGSLFGCWKR